MCHQVFDLKISDEQRENTIIDLIKERTSIRKYIESCYHEGENILTTKDRRFQSNLLEIERKMKVTDFQAFMTLINNKKQSHRNFVFYITILKIKW